MSHQPTTTQTINTVATDDLGAAHICVKRWGQVLGNPYVFTKGSCTCASHTGLLS